MTNDLINYPLLGVRLGLSIGTTLTLLFVSLYWRNSKSAMTSPNTVATFE